ncbi:DUF3293 domain-containing protein [Rhodoferax lacus]|uniref:DUF3293 domain-containing protein n=1 Tax=Rhodoferax lacus TaxID=2184758 RepID=A0A3E1R682_9BURK|nr:DUF3293 domain-containing protein [Rhodoferax lacus]RFO94733.1 DUF3293 domain-containing protein [Rhodoferax lacus]
MQTDSTLSPETIAAYRETHFHVLSEQPFVLQIGIASDALTALQKARHVECSAFITACNPFSQALDESTNAARQAALAQELKQRGLFYLVGLGQHPSNQWPGEASFLVLGLSREAAKVLGARFEQNAVVWCGVDGVPELVMLR